MNRFRSLTTCAVAALVTIVTLASAPVHAQSSCTYSATPGSLSAGASGQTGVVTLTASDGNCTWSATSDAAWVTLSGGTHGYEAQVLVDGAVAYWRLGESSGASAADASGHGLTGAVSGFLGWSETGVLADGDTAALFNGSSWISVNPSAFPALTSALTIEAWVKTAQTGAWQQLVGKGSNGSEWDLWLTPAGQLHLQMGTNPGTTNVAGTSLVADGGWHHIAATWTGSAVVLYLDGAVERTATVAGPLNTQMATALTIGRDAIGYPLTGSLDEIAVYDHALTAAQVSMHYGLRTSVSLQGSGAVTYAVAPNASSDPRTATLTIAGATVTVTQAGFDPAQCTTAVTPANITVGAAAASGAVAVRQPLANCAWTATSDAAWVTLTGSTYGYAGRVLADGAIAYWQLNENAGTTVADTSGHALSGEVHGALGWSDAGALTTGETAARFDGATWVSVAPANVPPLTTALTIETWLKSTPTGQWQQLVGKGSNGAEWDLWLTPAGQAHLQLGTAAGGTEVTGISLIADGQWHHVAAVWGGHTATLYIDGAVERTAIVVGPLATQVATPLTIGRDAIGYPFAGSLDEIAIYGSALTAGDVQAHVSLGHAAATVIGTGSVAYAVAANATSTPRSATLTIGGELVTVTQAALVAPTCTTTVSPSTIASDVPGAAGTLTVTQTDPSCSWTATSDADWVTLGPAFGYAGGVLAAAPVGYWRLGAGSGAAVSDASGHRLMGQTHGTVDWSQTGALADGDTAARFDGSSWLSVDAAAMPALTSALTIEAWVKTTHLGNWQQLIGKGSNGAEWDLWLTGSGTVHQQFGTAAGYRAVGGSTPIGDGQWHHVAVTWNGTTATTYVDGVVDVTATVSGPLTINPATGLTFARDPIGYPFTGSLDEIAIYDRALTAAEAAAHYALGRWAASSSGPGAVTYTVGANAGAARSATLTIGDATVGVTQSGVTSVGCTFGVAPASLSVDAAATSGQIGVTTDSGCGWTTSSNASWVSVTAGTLGAGSATYAIAANTSTVTRTGTLVVAGYVLNVTQRGIPVPSVTIAMTSPFPGTTFNNPSSIVLSASATVSNGSIIRVDFFVSGTLIGSATTIPYQAVWTSPAPNLYGLTAAAVDNVGHTTTSGTLAVTVASQPGHGTLGPPVAFPRTGAYGPAQTVTLTAAPGATIRYTIDGSTPTATSAIYQAPIAIADNRTIKAVALEDDWTTSAVMQEEYHLDTVPPVVTATLWPAANAAGWNNSDVTVKFTCTDDASGVAFCPPDVVISSEGEQQSVSGTGRDTAGNESTASVVVNLDKTRAVLTADLPADPPVTSAASYSVTAEVSDDRSGIALVTCNGVPVGTSQGSVSCVVPLRPGYNQLVLHVEDAAGNSTSKGLLIKRTAEHDPQALTISPAKRTLLSGETRAFPVVDESGTPVAGLNFTSSDSSVASVSFDANGAPRLTALAPGDATITASIGNVSAEGAIRVVAGTTLPTGTALWQLPQNQYGSPVYTNAEASGAQILWMGYTSDFTGMTLSALGSQGEQLWVETLPQQQFVSSAFGDVFGGVVGLAYQVGADGASIPTGLARLAGPGGGAPWEYHAPTRQTPYAGTPSVGRPVQGPDGTLYAIEYEFYGPPLAPSPWAMPEGAPKSASLVAIDGESGALRYRTSLPGAYNCTGNPRLPSFLSPPLITGPIIGADGAAYVTADAIGVTCFILDNPGTRDNGMNPVDPYDGNYTYLFSTQLVKATADGATSQLINRSAGTVVCSIQGCENPPITDVRIGQLIADAPGGGVIVSGYQYGPGEVNSSVQFQLQADGSRVDLPFDYFFPQIISTVGTTIVSLNDSYHAVDMNTKAVGASFALDGSEAMIDALPDGEWLSFASDTNTLSRFGSDGTRRTSATIPYMDSFKHADENAVDGNVYDEIGNVSFVRLVVAAPRSEAYYSLPNGNQDGQGGPTTRTGIFVKGYQVVQAGTLGPYYHLTVQVIPRNQARWRTLKPWDPPCDNASCFKNPSWSGYFATLGAETSSSLGCRIGTNVGTLVANFNRSRDVNEKPADGRSWERLNYPASKEDELIGRLLDATSSFIANSVHSPLPYACFPDPADGTYNSNTFVNGLLNSVSLPLPSFPSLLTNGHIYPGWFKPAPLIMFQP